MTPGITQLFKAFIQSFGDMGDIIDMAIKANDGKATYDVGELINRVTTGTIVSLTAASTKDLYLAGASVTLEDTAPQIGGNRSYQVHLTANGTTIDVWSFRAQYNASAISSTPLASTHNFKVTGAKVTTSQVFALNLAEVGTSCDVFGMLYGWQENTGDTPQI